MGGNLFAQHVQPTDFLNFLPIFQAISSNKEIGIWCFRCRAEVINQHIGDILDISGLVDASPNKLLDVTPNWGTLD